MLKVLFTEAIALWLLSGPLIGQGLARDAPNPVETAEAAQVSADTAFMLLSSALVLLMTPGLAFFYSGFVRSRNVLNTMMMSFFAMGLVGVT